MDDEGSGLNLESTLLTESHFLSVAKRDKDLNIQTDEPFAQLPNNTKLHHVVAFLPRHSRRIATGHRSALFSLRKQGSQTRYTYLGGTPLAPTCRDLIT